METVTILILLLERIFILEASLPYSKQINEYILNGNGNIDEIMANMPGWFLWDTQEMLNIINWMQEYNENSENVKKIQFHGIDITSPGYALNSIFNYLKKVDPTILKKYQGKTFAQDIINDNNWPTSLQRYSELSKEKKEVLNNNYNDLFGQIKQNEIEYISNSTDERIDIGLIRDNAMAQNTLWIIQNFLKDEKAIIWAHNVHITKSEFEMTCVPTKSFDAIYFIDNISRVIPNQKSLERFRNSN